MGMREKDVADWLRRQHAGKRDYREALRDDVLVLRPGPNFEWFMQTLAADQATPMSSQAPSETDQEIDRGPHQE